MKNEYGRSMIEMLGVLAIIGVLSIGGLAGYTMAMNRHRANVILDYVTKCGVMVQTIGDGSQKVNETDCNSASLLNQANPNKLEDASAVRAENGNTTVTFTVEEGGTAEAVASRVNVATGTTTFTFTPDTGTWAAGAAGNG